MILQSRGEHLRQCHWPNTTYINEGRRYGSGTLVFFTVTTGPDAPIPNNRTHRIAFFGDDGICRWDSIC